MREGLLLALRVRKQSNEEREVEQNRLDNLLEPVKDKSS